MLLEYALTFQIAGLIAFATAYKTRDTTMWLITIALAGINALTGGFHAQSMDTTFGNVFILPQSDVLALNLVIAAFSVVMLFIDMFSEGIAIQTPKSLISARSWFKRK